MAIYVRGDVQSLARQLGDLGRDKPKVVARALNRAIAAVQTRAVRAIADDLGVVQREVRKTMSVRKAVASQALQEASITSTGKRIPLLAFRARGPEPSRGKGAGVTYRLPTGRGRAPHAFLATMKTGHRGVFQRKAGATRLPIVELRGPSVPRVFKKHLDATLETEAAALFEKNVLHEIEYAISRRLRR